jgi:hypothetical protein
MNDATYLEAARGLAQRMMREAGRSPAARVRRGFQLATARRPSREEELVLVELARRKLADYRQDQDAALKLLRVGASRSDDRLDPRELAAWTTVASTILNMDETITKE